MHRDEENQKILQLARVHQKSKKKKKTLRAVGGQHLEVSCQSKAIVTGSQYAFCNTDDTSSHGVTPNTSIAVM